MCLYHEKLGHMLKPLVSKFRSDLSVYLKDIAEKLVPAKLKPLVEATNSIGTCAAQRYCGNVARRDYRRRAERLRRARRDKVDEFSWKLGYDLPG